MPPATEAENRYREAESSIASLLQSRGWRPDALRKSVSGGADLILERGGERFAVEIKAIVEGRADRALPLLSLAILQAKAYAREIDGAKPLAVLWVDRASPSLINHIRSFANDYAEGVAVGLVSANGLRHFVGHPFDELNAEPGNEKWRASRSPVLVNLFSDLNQWMLKILLANEIPKDLLSAPRNDRRSGAELAAAAGASAMSASRFLQQLRHEGFLDENSQRPHLVRRRELFDRWRAAVLRPVPEMAMKFVLRAPVREQLKELIAKQPLNEACLGLFAAAEELNFGHVSGVPAYVIVPKLPPAGDRKWRGLRPASPGDTPDLILRQAAFPRSIFRGAVNRDGWAATDVIQTWLDVGNHPARGDEQAELIYAKFLGRIVEQGSS